MFNVQTMVKEYLAVDLGATNLRAGIWNGERVTDKKKTSMVGINVHQVVEFLKDYALGSGYNFKSIGLASAGPLDVKRGIIRPINWIDKEIKIVKILEEELGVKVYLQNDCVASVLAERVMGAGKEIDNLLYITMSTGIGAGVIVNGHILLGKDGNAHEIGHLVVNYDDNIKCGCGGESHWEAYCGGSSMPKFFKKYSGIDVANSREIFEKARSGISVAQNFVKLCSKISAAGIGSAINAYDPELVTIGGSVFLNNVDLLLDEINKWIKQYVINKMPRIIPTPLDHDIPLIGAGILANNEGSIDL